MCVCVCSQASRSRATLSCDSSYYDRLTGCFELGEEGIPLAMLAANFLLSQGPEFWSVS